MGPSHVPRTEQRPCGAAPASGRVSRCIGQGLPFAARIGQTLAAARSWQLLAAGRLGIQQARGTSAESDDAWKTSQAATQSRSR